MCLCIFLYSPPLKICNFFVVKSSFSTIQCGPTCGIKKFQNILSDLNIFYETEQKSGDVFGIVETAYLKISIQ